MKSNPYAPLSEQQSAPPTHWRSLEQRSQPLSDVNPAEFESPIPTSDGFNRRDVLKLAGASLALGGMACIRRPEEEILPYTRMPESVIPGVRMNYATVINRSEGAVGVVVEANEGRPTKIEGNPLHRASLGGSDIWAQSDVLSLYDPDRSKVPLNAGKPATWEAFDAAFGELAGKLGDGKGLAILTEEDGGPTFERLLKAAQAKYPAAKVYRWDPLAADAQQAGAQVAFGNGARVNYELDNAKTLLAIDSDFLAKGPEHLRLAREFGKSRTVLTKEDALGMNRLYVVEGVFSTTGANADHRLRAASGQCGDVLKAIAHELGTKHGVALGELAGAVANAAVPAGSEKFIAAVAKDLAAHKGACAIFVGEHQPPAVHALGLALNALLDPAAAIVSVSTGDARTSMWDGLSALAKSLLASEVQTLVVFDSNPVFTAPGALKFGEAIAKAATVVHAGLMPDETAAKATWHVPTTHFLESWADARAWDGQASICQPLILPLFGSRPALSLIAKLAGSAETNDRKLVEETWRGANGKLAAVKTWRRALHDGFIPETARVYKFGQPNLGAVAGAVSAHKGAAPSAAALEVVAVFSHVLDGRLGNLTWNQELPDSMAKLCWDNAALVSPQLAKELKIDSKVSRNGYASDIVDLTVDGRKITIPTFVLPGLAPYTVAIVSGYGKTTGAVAKGIGVDVNPLLADATGVVQGVTLTKANKDVVLCSTQDHFSIPANPYKERTFVQMVDEQGAMRQLGLGERPLYRSGTAADMEKGDKFAQKGSIPSNLVTLGTPNNRPSKPIQLHDEVSYEGQQWGMTIDLGSCIGCNACAIACVAENNIPAVGREQVLLGRELHWIRIDRYFQGDIDDPKAAHQPLPCMHCENAPCEPVCPVAATTHDSEGLNSMAYNRCIGTRYCANNCPYKVRRFNYLDYTTSGNLVPGTDGTLGLTMKGDVPLVERMKTLKLQRNPDVSVRYRGVMEKCTYCTQRVEEAKIAAKRAGRDRKTLPDGAVIPACAQACPTQAITFGNINDPLSKVATMKANARNYEMLQELNVRPRTTFLARVKNENQELT